MEELIFTFWCLLIVLVPLAMGIAGVIGYRNNPNPVRLWALALGLIAHVFVVGLAILPMFLLMYAGAHTEPVGNALGTIGRIIWMSIEMTYAGLAFSLITFIAGRQRPWPLKNVDTK